MALQLSSEAFQANGPIPRKYTGEGEDLSPPLRWSGVPPGCKELALICDDPDAPRPTPWVHWVVYKIPPGVSGFAEGNAGPAPQGVNDFGRRGWGGPLPPRGHGTHRYRFKLYALREPLNVPAGLTRDQLLAEMKGKIIEQAELVGTYERR